MGDERDCAEGARRCLECGALATVTGKASVIHTAPGRVLIIKGDHVPDGAAPAVFVRCTNGHIYSLTTLPSHGGGAT